MLVHLCECTLAPLRVPATHLSVLVEPCTYLFVVIDLCAPKNCLDAFHLHTMHICSLCFRFWAQSLAVPFSPASISALLSCRCTRLAQKALWHVWAHTLKDHWLTHTAACQGAADGLPVSPVTILTVVNHHTCQLLHKGLFFQRTCWWVFNKGDNWFQILDYFQYTLYHSVTALNVSWQFACCASDAVHCTCRSCCEGVQASWILHVTSVSSKAGIC